MNFSHTKNQYLSSFKNKNNFIFFKKIKKFKSDPIPEFINIVENNNFSFLYESVEKGKDKGRYSICGYNTIKTIQINNRKKAKEKKLSSTNKNAFLKIDRTISKYKFLKDKKLPPMAGAFFGYISYENIYNIAIDILNQNMPYLDITDGATHYHAYYVSPKWAKDFRHTTTIDDHIFYRYD